MFSCPLLAVNRFQLVAKAPAEQGLTEQGLAGPGLIYDVKDRAPFAGV